VLAHRVSLLSVHAGALEFRPDAPAEEVAAAAGVIRRSATSVLEELREVIGVLREGGEQADVAPPQPTLAAVPGLVEESRAAGGRVTWSLEVPPGHEPPALVGRTAYRVVQEGLTNARKHAPGAAVGVRVEGEPGGTLVASVVSRRALAPLADGSAGWGTGLVGLRERVTLAGGRLHHGVDADGDFVLRADLPWPA
jgi:signal transduction histidine kinase